MPNKLAGIPALSGDLSWDHYFILQAMLAAAKSKDDSTWVGVVLVRDRSVIATGFNGFPRGVREMSSAYVGLDANGSEVEQEVRDPVRWARPEKYRWVEHAERNAIYQAARLGHRTEGSVMYMNTTGVPCADCTRALIQAGVVGIVARDLPSFGGAGEGVHYHCGEVEATMLHEAGIWFKKIPDFAPDYRYTGPR